MAFSSGQFTNAGLSLVQRVMAGQGKLIFSRAVGSSDLARDILTLTDIEDQVQELSITGLSVVEGGVSVTVQASSTNLETSYLLRQIGIYARVGLSGTDELLLVIQDEQGITIPASDDVSGFVFDFSVFISMSVTDVEVNLDSQAYMTVYQIQRTLGDVPRIINSLDFIVPVSDWRTFIIPSTDQPIYQGLMYCAEVLDENISQDYYPNTVFDPSSMETVIAAGVSSVCETQSGSLYLFSKEIPGASIRGTCHLFLINKNVLRNLSVEVGSLPSDPEEPESDTWGAMFDGTTWGETFLQNGGG